MGSAQTVCVAVCNHIAIELVELSSIDRRVSRRGRAEILTTAQSAQSHRVAVESWAACAPRTVLLSLHK